MGKVSMTDILELSVPERILLVEDVWDSIAASPETINLTDAQRQELDQRLDDYHANPDAGSPWEDVRARILKRR
ncbi:MAG: addiction module protein [Candidatus Sumerlaeota bacterium]|nr:addiction module protein [Candidatus Sumerlaeota bacterium]